MRTVRVSQGYLEQARGSLVTGQSASGALARDQRCRVDECVRERASRVGDGQGSDGWQ